MSKKQWILLAFIIGCFALLYPYCFDSKVDPNGDNVSYYLLGKGLVNGSGYVSYYTVPPKPETHFPPGYPALIAAIGNLSGAEIETIKATNGLFFLIVILLVFLLALKLGFSDLLATATALSVMISPNILRFSTIMMSELFYSALSMGFLVLCTRIKFDVPWFKSGDFLFALIVLIASIYVRSVGIAMVFGATVYFVLGYKWKHAMVMVGVATIAVLPWIIRANRIGGNTYAEQLSMVNPYDSAAGQVGLMDLVNRVWGNAIRYFAREIPSGIFELHVASNTRPYSLLEWIFAVALVAIIAYGAIKWKAYRWLLYAYVAAFFGILLLWPSVWIGPRFIIPIIPLLLMMGWNGVHHIVELDWPAFRKDGFLKRSHLIMGLLFFYAVAQYPNIKSLNEIGSSNYVTQLAGYIKAAQWVKENTPEDAIVCCRKGSLFHLFSERKVTGYRSTLNAEWLFQDLEDKGVDYLVLDEFGFASSSAYLKPAGLKYPDKVEFVYMVPKSKTFVGAFHPNLGYSGTFLNDKRHGWGTLRWAIGQCFDGAFKNGKAHGRGELYYPNGLILKGAWNQDRLDGPAEVYNAKGQKIEDRLYKEGTIVSYPES